MTTPTLPDLREHAERMFEACSELRLADAERGRDSDVYFGRCHTLADLGLIAPERVRQLDAQVADLINAHYGVRHAA